MSTREVARGTLVVLGIAILAVVLFKIAPVVMLAFAGIVLATMVRAASDPLARRAGLGDHAAVVIVMLVLAALLGAGGWLFGREIATQADALWKALVAAATKVQEYLSDSALGSIVSENVQGAANSETVAHVAKGTVTAFGAIADLGLVLFLAVYLALDPWTYRRGLLRLAPVSVRPRLDAALRAAGTDLRKWLLGQLGAMVTVGVAIGAGLALVGAPLAVPLGVLSALLEFVPVVGPILATAVGVLIAFAQGPQVALHAAVVYVVVLALEGNVIIPLAQKWAVEMPPALGLVAIAVSGILFGLVGVLFAMPLTVVVVRLVNALYVSRIDGGASGAPPENSRARRRPRR